MAKLEVAEFGAKLAQSRAAGYAGSVVLVILATLLRLGVHPWLGANAPFNTFYIAVALSAWWWGTGPALCATLVSLVAADYFFISPGEIFRSEFNNTVSIVRTISYFAVTCSFIGITAVLKRREREAAMARDRAHESDARYSTVFHFAAVGIVRVQFDTTAILDANDAFCRMVGYTPEELRRTPWTQLRDPEKANSQGAGGETEIYTGEKRLAHKQGHLVWVRLTRSLVRDSEGEPDYEIAVVEDISERKRAEEALQRSEERYREFIANSSEGVWRLEFEPPIDASLPVDEQVELAYRRGRMAECNDAMARMYGLKSAPELLTKSLDFMLPSSEARSREFVASIIRAGYRANEVESTDRDASGNVVFFSNSMAGVVEGGRLTRMWGTQRDITERKRTQEALRRERERLSLALTAGAMGVYDLDLVEDRLWWSAELYAVFGVSPSSFKLTVETFRSLVHPEDRQGLRQGVARAIETRQTFAHEFRIVRPDGLTRWVGNRAQTEYNREGVAIRHFGVAMDVTERKRADERLLEQQQLLKSLTDNATVSLFIMDECQQCVFMNPAAEKLTGFALEEVRGKSLHDVIHHTRPDGSHYALSECPIDRALPENNQEQGEEVFVHKDGSFYDVAFTASPIRDASGKPIGTVVEVRNITDEKRAAVALRESEGRLRLFIEHAPAAIAMFDREMRYLAVSRRWIQDYHLTGNLVGRSHYEIFPDVPERWKETHRRALAGQVLRADEDPFPRADGTMQWIKWEVRPWTTAAGEIGGILVAAEDITVPMRAKHALLENEAVLRTVTNEAHVGLVMVNKERQYLFANHTYAEILGLPDENIVGKRVPEVLSTVYDQIGPKLDEAFGGQRVTYELRVPAHPTTRDERFYEVVYEPRVENATDPYVVVVLVDITERKKMQHTLERMVEERTAKLRETVGELEAFSYSIAHDMRAPLRAMQGFSGILQEEYGEKLGEGNEYLRRIAASANRLDSLIEDVLNYSKIVRASLPLHPIQTDKFIREIVESYPNLQSARAEIRVEGPIPPVLANSAALTQVVSNLLGNAVKFVAPGVRPRVRVRGERRPEQTVRISFEDNGIGIPKEVQSSIFMMFQRLNAPEQYEGTGIGLTIAKKAVERMGGTVGVESEPGKGSRFWIELKEA